ncbi:MAG: hypothetical protein QXZ31_08650 [Thermofilaceae archaeon]
MEWYLTIGIAAGVVACVALLAYLIKAQREFVKLVLQEKVDVINTILPLLEALTDYVPPTIKPKLETVIEVVKVSKSINEALIEAPIWKLSSTYAGLKMKYRK